MSLFSYKKKTFETRFSSRSEAFNAMLAYLIDEKNVSPMEAAKQANEFAEIFATNMGLPTNLEPEKKGFDKAVYYLKESVTVIKENPELVQYGVPFLTFLVGLLTGKKVEGMPDMNQPQAAQPEQANQPPIDFDKIPD